MEAWDRAYHGALGVYLYDSYGFDIFRLNINEAYANQFKGMRVDSGDNFDQLSNIIQMYKEFGINHKGKQVIFSNALDTDRTIQIHNYAKNVCLPSFGIGTHFTADWSGIADGIVPMNIVIKLVAIKECEEWPFYNDTCKLSEDKGKHTGKLETVRRFMEQLPQYRMELEDLKRNGGV
jgi:nicotinate phosphoribosyltransferase